jgi:small subunit ribosomal protein S8
MSLSDPIADMLTRVRNAYAAGLKVADMPHSKMKMELARILKREGYVADYSTEAEDGKRTLRVFLKYDLEETPVIKGIKRISKPSIRRYVGAASVPRVLGGLGVAVLSTSAGVMSDREARRKHIGGEVICYVW